MTSFLRKRVTILGRSIPVAGVALAIAVVGVAAAFAFRATVSISVTAMPAPAGTWTAWSCAPAGTGPGQVDSETPSGEADLALVVSGIDDESRIRCQTNYTNTNGVTQWLELDSSALDGSGVAAIGVGSFVDGMTLSTGSGATLKIDFTFAEIAPGAVLADLEVYVDITYYEAPAP